MNKVILIGRITKDLEIRYTSNEKAVCEFSLAINRDKENTDFINCVVWNKPAENLVKYQSKGSLISVIGELRTDTYEKDGEKRYKTYVLVNNIEYLSSIKKDEIKEESDPFKEFGETIEVSQEELPF